LDPGGAAGRGRKAKENCFACRNGNLGSSGKELSLSEEEAAQGRALEEGWTRSEGPAYETGRVSTAKSLSKEIALSHLGTDC